MSARYKALIFDANILIRAVIQKGITGHVSALGCCVSPVGIGEEHKI